MLPADLTYFRRAAEIRGNGVAIALAYLDLDYFKSYNDLLGEVRVDVQILPPIMRVFETFVAERGYAYRFGGDEYVLLLANTTLEEACRSFTMLRARLAHLQVRRLRPSGDGVGRDGAHRAGHLPDEPRGRPPRPGGQAAGEGCRPQLRVDLSGLALRASGAGLTALRPRSVSPHTSSTTCAVTQRGCAAGRVTTGRGGRSGGTPWRRRSRRRRRCR